MKISDQNIQFASQHQASMERQQQRVHEEYLNGQLVKQKVEKVSVKESSYQGQLQKDLSPSQSSLPSANPAQDNARLTGQNPANSLAPNSAETAAVEEPFQPQLSPELIKMIEAIEAMMERMTGKPYTLKVMGYSPDETSGSTPNSTSMDAATQTNAEMASNRIAMPPNQNAVTGERTVLSDYYRESETLAFQASGHIDTADGKRIDFDFKAGLHREFEQHLYVEEQKGLVVTDPLVVNFGGEPAQLTLDKIQFDLDNDGQLDEMSFVEQGSGFLALDKNQDGQINNGSELFGPQTGKGFAELSTYDDDGNGWIDENDAIFSQLQIWHKNEQGLPELKGLLELNVGAIYLEHADTPFSHKSADNELLGQVVSSGIYLSEDARVGSVQQIDLVT